MTAVFCGHRDAPDSCYASILSVCRELIEQKNCRCFLLGNQGNFDRFALRALRELIAEYPDLQVEIVLAYLPKRKELFPFPTLFPEELEKVPFPYRIPERNRWMLSHADCLICYVTHKTGGSDQLKKLAEKKKKLIFNLAADGASDK